MEATTVTLIVSGGSLGLFFLTHLILWQFQSIMYRGVNLMAKVAAFVYAVVALGGKYGADIELMGHIFVSLPLYLLFIMLYMHFYVGIDKSVSIRLLGELLRNENQSMTLVDIESLYPPGEMVIKRLDLLAEKGFLAVKDGKYECTEKGKIFSRSVKAVQRLYSLAITG